MAYRERTLDARLDEMLEGLPAVALDGPKGVGKTSDDLLDAVVVTTGPQAYRRSDGIAVVPAALLGP